MVRKLVRALLAAGVLATMALAWLSRTAGAAVFERVGEAEAGIAAYLAGGGTLSTPRSIEINGQTLHVSTGTSRDDVRAVLDFYERRYPAARLRRDTPERGMIVALSMAPADWIDRLRQPSPVGRKGAIGKVRLVYATRSPSGGTRFLTAWTDPGFDASLLFAGDGDAPGFELAAVPRPVGGRRLLAARERGGRFRFLIYETPQPVGAVVEYYAGAMKGRGWRPRPRVPTVPPPAAVRYVRGSDECTLGLRALADGGTQVTVAARVSDP